MEDYRDNNRENIKDEDVDDTSTDYDYEYERFENDKYDYMMKELRGYCTNNYLPFFKHVDTYEIMKKYLNII
jgi:hypothetical protein